MFFTLTLCVHFDIFCYYLFHVLARIRYKILAASKIKDNMTPEKAAQVILEQIQLDPEQYRMGKTKVQFYKTLYFALITILGHAKGDRATV